MSNLAVYWVIYLFCKVAFVLTLWTKLLFSKNTSRGGWPISWFSTFSRHVATLWTTRPLRPDDKNPQLPHWAMLTQQFNGKQFMVITNNWVTLHHWQSFALMILAVRFEWSRQVWWGNWNEWFNERGKGVISLVVRWRPTASLPHCQTPVCALLKGPLSLSQLENPPLHTHLTNLALSQWEKASCLLTAICNSAGQ